MRIPYSWLREVVSAGAPGWDVGPGELEQALVRIGHEVEDVARLGPVEGPLAVGRVSEIEELSGFKKPIRACLVDVGNPEPQEIVCGATNFVVGDLVVVALPGATLPGDFTIAARKTYGRNSNGMICSAAELGLGADHSGILVLPPGTAEPGADGAAVLGLDDVVFHLAITPDRGYGLSVRGLAREIACAYDLDFVDPAAVEPLPAQGEAWPLTVDPATGVRRFALRPVTGIDPAAVSPWWLQRRLLLCGIRATSPAVDVTNYVMLELGHPMHAHDRARITGGFRVRFARPGETVVTLDDIERKLEPVDVLIVDDVATAAIGGVMGADSTEVRADSADVLLEAAVWDPAAISRTQRRLHLPSEAARRYERAVDPAISVAVLDRCARLLVDIAGGVAEPALTDWRGDPPRADWSPPSVEIPADLPDRIAGVAYPPGTTARRLAQVGARVRQDGGILTVTPPSWRPDLRQPADLVEEVLRLEGLEAIPSVLPSAPSGRGLTATQQRRRAIGKSLALSGYVEILPTPFLPAGVFDLWGLPAEDPRRSTTHVINPLEADRPHLATTLLPALLEALHRNVSRGLADLALFAVAQVVQPTEQTRAVDLIPVHRRPTDAEIATLDASLPRQPQHVAAVLAGLREPRGPWGPGRPVEAADAFEAVRIIARASGVDVTFRAAQYLPWHPGRCAEVLAAGTVVGHAGQLHPAVIERAGLPKGTCAIELNLDAIPVAGVPPAPRVSPFPAVFQDVSLVVADDVPAQAVEDAVREGAGELLEHLQLFDVFAGPQIGKDRKSLTFALRFRAPDRTLTEDDATAARDAAVRCAAERLGAELRS
ncbi:phenylalanine--tRNA ligase subunit beta [Mycobacterium paragordonae]|uniref:Phenylalanine--tRNA ligase beta subunit n=2 Tax=Mycobacterium TaxID=1763 RepID=A0A3G9GWR9_MYCGO|nr:phenylalanine--tRNA ligase subunit beta [Mycobacterium paragordonae]BBF95596.1 phenylalanine tRNA synthetase, beta subunit [Mycobacterium gordonae]MDP7735205.1 phenylalanine--tRNA ligase subunit beta [Mycobacterium paragordonae]TDK88927.1 phenylalanine--tRNA ligase subunit beta [Mycobacterium paragordonae]TDK95871.1 phenylalanine--tRNA ligase subunit beta [Mycobacterium paragordonae]TDL02704.1 phenylalanine--tRNA ligase subunit beta [Mycobacterium paragordonae]